MTVDVKKVSAGGLFVAGLTGGAIAAVVNYVLYFAAGAAGVSFAGEFDPTTASLPVPAIGISSVVSAIPAAIVALILTKVVAKEKAATIFAIVSVVFCVLSFGGPMGVKGLGTGAIVVMNVMHAVAGAGIAGMIWRKLKS